MKVDVEYTISHLTIKVEYTLSEWLRLESIYRGKGLELVDKDDVFREQIVCRVWIYRHSANLLYGNYEVRNGAFLIRLTDDISLRLISVYSDGIDFNAAIFRIVPECDERKCVTEITVPIKQIIPPKLINAAVLEAVKKVVKVLNEKKIRYIMRVETE